MKKTCVASLLLFFLIVFVQPSQADLPGWTKTASILIDNSTNSSALTNHQVLLIINTQTLVTNGDLQADGDDIRFLDSDDATQLSYWIESGINTSSTRVWIKVPSIPASSTKTIFFYYDNPSASSASSMTNTMVLGEVGTATVSASYSTANLTNTYTAPVVVATPVEGSDNVEVSVRIKNITTNSFQIKLHNPSGTAFNADTVNYFVVEKGTFATLEGKLIESTSYTESNQAGTGADTFTTLSFAHTYTISPVIFSQVVTDNDTRWTTETIRNVTTTSAQSSLELAETASAHNNETMNWIALQRNTTGAINNILYETKSSGDNVRGHDNGNYTTTFTQVFGAAPLVITDMRRRDAGEGGWAVIESVSATVLTQHIEEDNVGDSERSHTTEDTSIIAFEEAGGLVFRKFTSVQPTVTAHFPITKLVFTTAAQTIDEDRVSSVMTVQTQDQFSAVQSVTSDTTLALSSTSSTGQFSLTSSPFTPITSITIPSGSSSQSFYYKDSTPGTPAITVSEAPSQGWSDASQSITVREVLFQGGYKIPITINNTGCVSTLTNHQVQVTLNTQALISAGKMQSDGDDIRFYDSDDRTVLNYWIESGINTTSTSLWVKVPSIPASSSKTIYLYYGLPSAAAASSLANTMVLGEVGTASISASYATVNLLSTYTSPVVVASYVEGSDNQEVSIRIKNVGTGSFDIKLQHPSGSGFNANTAYYFVLESGKHATLNNVLIEAARYNATNVIGPSSGDNTWGTVSFAHSYASAPVVFSQAMTENDSGWITEAIRNVGTATFQSAMERAELAGNHNDETIGWIAMVRNSAGTINGITYQNKTSGDNVRGHDNGNFTTTFSPAFGSAPRVITDMRRRDATEGGWTAIESITTTALRQHIEEDRVLDAERAHTTEDTSVIAFSGPGQLGFRSYVCATQPSSTLGSEEAVISQLTFITSEQTITQNQVSSVITVQTQDINGNPLAFSSDVNIELSSSSSTGEFSDSAAFVDVVNQVTLLAGQSSVDFYYRDTTIGSFTLSVSENPAQGWSDDQQNIEVLSSVGSFIVAASSPQIAGEAFSMTITALDDSGVTAASYNEAVNLGVNYVSPSLSSGGLSVTQTASFINGVAVIPSQIYSNCGTIQITVSASTDVSKTGSSGSIYFAPASFDVTLDELDNQVSSGTSTHTINKPFTLNMTARQSDGSVCSSFIGPAELSVTEINPAGLQGGVITPALVPSTDWVNGVAQRSDLLYDRWGEIALQVKDSVLTSQTGASPAVRFIPKDFLVSLSAPPLSRDFYYVNEELSATVSPRDFADQTVSNYQGTVRLSGAGLILPEDGTFTLEEAGSHTFSAISADSDLTQTQIIATDTTDAQLTGSSSPFDVKAASIQVFPNQGPVGELEMSVSIIDSNGDVITQDNATAFTVTLDEVIDDNSSSSEAVEIPGVMTEGSASITVTDDQAESVDVIPLSTPALTPLPGTATFGTVSGGGLGIQVHRELKDEEHE